MAPIKTPLQAHGRNVRETQSTDDLDFGPDFERAMDQLAAQGTSMPQTRRRRRRGSRRKSRSTASVT
jgi:hypothetical protein